MEMNILYMDKLYKSQREDPINEYLKDARLVRLTSIKIIKKFPVSYRYIISNNMLDLATNIFRYSLMANSIKIDNKCFKEDFKLKHEYLSKAKASCVALLGDITFIYDLIKEGNNFFENKKDYGKTFQKWSEVVSQCLKNITKTLDNLKEKQSKRFAHNTNSKAYNN